MPAAESWNVGRLLTWTADYLKRHGSPTARLDAEVLLAHCRKCDRISLYTSFAEDVEEPVRAKYRDLVRRRADGEPVAYLVGHREFYSLDFDVNPDVLIPRPETEHLVVRTLDLMAARSPDHDRQTQLADVGTGSGAIAVSLAIHTDNCALTAIDSSAAALAVARRNVARHGVEHCVTLLQGDLLDALPASARLDFVVSNPPYVSQSEYEQLPKDVRVHEPFAALVAGPTGTEVIARLIPQAASRLHPGGWLLMEISPMIEKAVRQLLTDSGGFQSISTTKDTAGRARIVEAQRSA